MLERALANTPITRALALLAAVGLLTLLLLVLLAPLVGAPELSPTRWLEHPFLG